MQKPLFLLADSQPLFFNQGSNTLLERIRQQLDHHKSLTAAYIGASNGDQGEYFEIFEVAMQSLGIHHCRHIHKVMDQHDITFLGNADIILLSGGDVQLGWQCIEKLATVLQEARQSGAVCIGISAGAVQMGQLGWFERKNLSNHDLFSTLAWVPYVISAHEEAKRWPQLKQVISLTAGCVKGIGIQHGSAAIVNPDGSIEALQKPLLCISLEKEQLYQQPAWKLESKR